MANWKLGDLGYLGNIIPSFPMSKFSILPYSQNWKLGFKNLGEKFPSFPSFRPGLGSCPFFSISVSFCLLDWVLLLPLCSSFFSCFLISFVLSFASSLLASHCWEVIVFSVSLMYFKSFFKFSICSFYWRADFYLHWYLYSFFLFVTFFLLPLTSLHKR